MTSKSDTEGLLIALGGDAPSPPPRVTDFLGVKAPFDFKTAPNAYSFERSRDLEINWKKALEFAKLDEKIEISRRESVKSYFENLILKGLDTDEEKENKIRTSVVEIRRETPAYTVDPKSVYNTKHKWRVEESQFVFKTTDNNPVRARDYRIAPRSYPKDDGSTDGCVAISEGCVIEIGLPNEGGKRWFVPYIYDANGARVGKREDFVDGKWSDGWSKLTDLAQVFFDINDPDKAKEWARTGFSTLETVRADAFAIRRRFAAVNAETDIGGALGTRATTILKEMDEAPLASLKDLMFQYRELVAYKPRADQLLAELVEAARRLGYVLITETDEYQYFDNTGEQTAIKLEKGELYQTSQRTVTWYTYQTIISEQKSWFRKVLNVFQQATEHTKTFTYFEKVEPDADPWDDIVAAYVKDGYSVFLFQQTAAGLVSSSGNSITSVLQRCSENEFFRRSCIIGVPIFEQTVVGESFLVGYHFFIRPLPEIIPSVLPALSMNQLLSYRFAWTGSHLGELVATIPLSPGEERTVTIATAQKYETSKISTVNSLMDITRIDRSDFETIFEREVRREKDVHIAAETEVKAKFKFVSGSAKLAASVDTKDMSRQLNRCAQRAAQEVNRRTKEETSVSVSEKTESTSSTTTTYKVRNINEGRTLNVNFFRLVNAFKSALEIADFSFSVEGGIELVAGSLVRDKRTFSRENVCEFFEYLFSPSVLPIIGLDPDAKRKFAQNIVQQIASQLAKEFEQSTGDDPDLARLEVGDILALVMLPTTSFGLLSHALLIPEVQQRLIDLPDEDFCEFLKSVFSDEKCDLNKLVRRFFNEIDFAYDSGGLYADVVVGSVPATEQYSENMRRIEEEKQRAEARLSYARGTYLNARAAKQLLGIGKIVDPTKIFVTDKAVEPYIGGSILRLRLQPEALLDRGWIVQVAGSEDRYIQQRTVEGFLEFDVKNPKYGDGGKEELSEKSHRWFETNVTVENPELGLFLRYKAPG